MINVFWKIIDVGFFRVFMALSSILFYSISSRNLSVEEYSVLREIFLYIEILPTIIIFGLNSSIPKLLSEGYELKSVLLKTFIFILALSFLSLLFLVFFVGAGFFLNNILVVVVSLCTASVQILTAFLINQNRTRSLSVSSFFVTFVFLAACSISFFVEFSSLDFVVLRCIYASILLIVPIYVMSTEIQKLNDYGKRVISIKLLYSSTQYFGMASIIAILSANLDKIIVKLYSTDIEFAIYATGAFEVPVVGILTGAVTSVLLSEICNKISIEDYSSARIIFHKISSLTIPIILPAFFILHFNSNKIIEFLFGKDYLESSVVFKSYLFLLLSRIVVFSPIMVALGLGKSLLTRTVLDLFFVAIISIFIVNSIGYQYVGYSIVISTFVFLIPFNFYHISRKLNKSVAELFPFCLFVTVFIGLSICYLLFAKLDLGLLSSGFLFSTVSYCCYFTVHRLQK